LGVGIDQDQGGIRGLEEGTIRAEHRMAGNRDQAGREGGRIAVARKVDKSLVGIEAAEDNRGALAQRLEEVVEGHEKEDSGEQLPSQVPG
jgi:hypothetical protein